MWLNEYEELMFSHVDDDEKTLKAVQIKYDNMPEIFYKYRSVNDNTLNAFKNDTLYFSAISMFNDPYECAMTLSYIQIKELMYNIILEKLKPFLIPGFSMSHDDFSSQDVFESKINQGLRIPKENQWYFEDMWKLTDDTIRKKSAETGIETSQIGDEIYRVCSFSTVNDSLLMWAHYSDNHKGFCIGYNFKEVNDNLTELMLPVIYCDDLLEISKYMFPNSNKSLIMNAITRKSRAWEYEREWRILILAANEEKFQIQRIPVPKSIFLGTRITEENKSRIIEIASEKNMDIYQIHMRIDEFKLYYERICV